MYDGNDVFVIDLTSCMGTSEIINSISLALEIPGASNKKINLKFKDTVLSQSQLLSIKSLVSSFGSTLNNVETTSAEMKTNCEAIGLNVYLNVDSASQMKIDENKIVIPEFQAKPENEFEPARKAEEFYAKAEGELAFEPELKEEDLPNQEINIEEAIHQSAKVAFENATNLDFMQEIIEEAKIKEDAPAGTEETEEQREQEQEEFCKISYESPKENFEETIFETVKMAVKDEISSIDSGSAAENTAADGEDKQFISVYKKAYEEEKEEYEEIDFYAPPTDEPVVIDSTNTIYVNQTLRSGQVLEYDGNIVIIGDCHPGSEIKASGDITIWGVLGSIAHAGMKGNKEAKIRALKMNAVQLRIANCYSRRPDGTNIPYIIKSSTFTPEEARLSDEGIVLYKIK